MKWLSCIQGCPKGILDIVNSKACRGAIMFNDELSVAQCRDLVQQLSQCTFPFQCAHGRPSIVPLTILEQPTLSTAKSSSGGSWQNDAERPELWRYDGEYGEQATGRKRGLRSSRVGSERWDVWMRKK